MKEKQRTNIMNIYDIKKKHQGITLIALVITIIVLLILAGVTISALSGENGILTEATDASRETKYRNAEEQVQIAVTGSVGKTGNLDNEKLKTNLDKIPNIVGVPAQITDSSYPITVTVDEIYTCTIGKDGTIGIIMDKSGIEVGDYVDYKYDNINQPYELLTTKSGASNNQEIPQTKNLKWRVLEVNADGSIDLISETSTQTDVYLANAVGYNNAVYLINDICEKQYSSTNLGVKARSIKIEDIEERMNTTGKNAINNYTSAAGIQYNHTNKYERSDLYYPELYARENGSGINTEEIKTNGIGVSDKGYDNATENGYITLSGILTVKQTEYWMRDIPTSYFTNTNTHSVIFENSPYHWIASRYVACNANNCNFGLRYINYKDDTLLGSTSMMASNKYKNENHFALRPIVTLPSNIQLIESSQEGVYQILK